MKRRNRDFSPESSFRTSSAAALHGSIRSPATRPDARSNPAEGPKTLEYAFFKKLKRDAGGQRYDSMQREKNGSNMLNSSEYCGRVIEGILGNISKSTRIHSNDFKSQLPVKNVSCEDSRLELPLPINNMTEIIVDTFNSPVDRVANINSGFQSDEAGLFSGKRQKLRQWAHSSFPEIDELCSKGYDLISVLLTRLLPWGNEKNRFKSTKSAVVERDTKSELLACPNSGIPSKKLLRMPKENIMEVEYLPCLENLTSSYWPGRSRETMLSNICSPTYNNHRTLQNHLELPSCEPGQKNLISCIEEDSTFDISSMRHGSFLPLSPSKMSDDFHDGKGPLPGREPHLLLLEWDSVNMNERSLSTTCQNTANWTIFPAVQNSWGDPPQTPNNCLETFDTLGLCPLPVLEDYPQDVYPLVPSNSTIYDEHKFGRYILEEAEEMVADVNHLPLALSNSPKYLNLVGDCNHYEIAFKDGETSDIVPSPGNNLGLMSKAFGEEINTPRTGSHLSFSLDEWKCLQPSGFRRDRYFTYNDLQFPELENIHSNFLCEDGLLSSLRGSIYRNLIHSSENILDIHDWRSFYSRLPGEKDKAQTMMFLLDKSSSSWEECTEEAYNEGNEITFL